MKKNAKKLILPVVAISVLLASVLALAGCAGGKGTLSAEVIAETGAFKIVASDAPNNAGIKSAGAVTLKDGDALIVSPDLQKGSLQVTITSGSGTVVLDEKVDGRILDTYEVNPGTYDVEVTCKQAGTTGALVIAATNAAEFEKQNKDLEAVLTRDAGSEAAEAVTQATTSKSAQ